MVPYKNICCYLACQAREKFVSVRKGTRAEVVTGLEEVNRDNLFFFSVSDHLFNFCTTSLIPNLQDLHNAKSAFERCRFNLVCMNVLLYSVANFIDFAMPIILLGCKEFRCTHFQILKQRRSMSSWNQ